MENLRQMRINKGLTMKQLGEMTDVSESQIGMIETGKRKPSFELLLKLCEVFDCSIDDLVYGKKIPITESDGLKENMIDLSVLTEDQRKAIQDIISMNQRELSAALPALEFFVSQRQGQDDPK